MTYLGCQSLALGFNSIKIASGVRLLEIHPRENSARLKTIKTLR